MSIQRTPEWFQARLGKATASRFKDVLATIKSGEAAARRNYRAELVVERMTGKPTEGYTNAAMQWGIDNEPYARETYEILVGEPVFECGFIEHGRLMAGASPDGLVGDDGLVEIKCPTTANHIDILLAKKMPEEYKAQVQGQMWIAERQWCDFVSYDPRMPVDLQMVRYRVQRDDAYIQTLEREVDDFLLTVDRMIDSLEKLAEAV